MGKVGKVLGKEGKVQSKVGKVLGTVGIGFRVRIRFKRVAWLRWVRG